MARTLFLIGIAGVTCLLVLWFVSPRLLSPNAGPVVPGSNPNNASNTNTAASGANSGTAPTSSLPPITGGKIPTGTTLPNLAPPESPEQKAIQDYEAQRAPFYAFLHDQCGALVLEGRPALDDRAILSLYCARNDDRIVTDILTQIVNPYAYAYGFRHVRFYLPNPPGSVEKFRLAAEANAAGPHDWQAFQK